jgi:hypothetical protein
LVTVERNIKQTLRQPRRLSPAVSEYQKYSFGIQGFLALIHTIMDLSIDTTEEGTESFQ